MKQNAPKISVVMPVWNATKYLPQSIESILNQNFDDFELIIIDDGSTDRSVEIVNSYRNRDRNIVVCENPHNFINSLNTGIALSRGEYIVRMDADDIMLPDRLEVQFCFMEENPEIDVCGSWMEIFGANSHMNTIDLVRKQDLCEQLNMRFDEASQLFESETLKTMTMAQVNGGNPVAVRIIIEVLGALITVGSIIYDLATKPTIPPEDLQNSDIRFEDNKLYWNDIQIDTLYLSTPNGSKLQIYYQQGSDSTPLPTPAP